MSKKSVVTETLSVESGAPSRVRAPRGIYLATLKTMTPGSEKFFRVDSKQQQSVRQIAYKNQIAIHAEAEVDSKTKKPTGKFRIFRTR